MPLSCLCRSLRLCVRPSLLLLLLLQTPVSKKTRRSHSETATAGLTQSRRAAKGRRSRRGQETGGFLESEGAKKRPSILDPSANDINYPRIVKIIICPFLSWKPRKSCPEKRIFPLLLSNGGQKQSSFAHPHVVCASGPSRRSILAGEDVGGWKVKGGGTGAPPPQ